MSRAPNISPINLPKPPDEAYEALVAQGLIALQFIPSMVDTLKEMAASGDRISAEIVRRHEAGQ